MLTSFSVPRRLARSLRAASAKAVAMYSACRLSSASLCLPDASSCCSRICGARGTRQPLQTRTAKATWQGLQGGKHAAVRKRLTCWKAAAFSLIDFSSSATRLSLCVASRSSFANSACRAAQASSPACASPAS